MIAVPAKNAAGAHQQAWEQLQQKNKLATVKAHVHRCPGGWAAEVKVAKKNGFQYVVCLSVQACCCTHCKASSSAVMTATAMITVADAAAFHAGMVTSARLRRRPKKFYWPSSTMRPSSKRSQRRWVGFLFAQEGMFGQQGLSGQQGLFGMPASSNLNTALLVLVHRCPAEMLMLSVPCPAGQGRKAAEDCREEDR
jgi:hypothetical protein